MSYMQDIDKWLGDLLQGLAPDRLAEAKTEIKAKLLESYRNGQGAGRNDGPKPPVADRRNNRREYRRPYRNGR